MHGPFYARISGQTYQFHRLWWGCLNTQVLLPLPLEVFGGAYQHVSAKLHGMHI